MSKKRGKKKPRVGSFASAAVYFILLFLRMATVFSSYLLIRQIAVIIMKATADVADVEAEKSSKTIKIVS